MLGVPPKQKKGGDHLGIYAATLTITQTPRNILQESSTYYTTCIPSMSKPAMDNYPTNPPYPKKPYHIVRNGRFDLSTVGTSKLAV